MQCEKCNSDNTQRLEVAYEGGTQNIQTTSRTTGLGFGRGGLGVGAATTSTSGKAHSLLANRAAPPSKKGYKYQIFFGFLAWLLFTATTAFSMWFFVSVSVMALCAYLIFAAFQFNSKVWPEQLAYWQSQWVCLKCGHIYHVE